MRRKINGKFWSAIRARAWEIAKQMHAENFLRSHNENPTPPTRAELREEGYWYEGKCRALREWNDAHRGLREEKPPTYEEWAAIQQEAQP